MTKKLILPFIAILIHIFPLNPITIITIPKSGSHLILKCSQLLLKKEREWILPETFSPSSETLLFFINKYNRDKIIMSHLYYGKDYSSIFLQENGRIIFNLRDPRDQIVSFAHYKKEIPEWYPEAIGISIDNIITDLIININNYYNYWLPWIDFPYALTIRFEDLVGSKGGGNDAQQLATIKAIAKHVSVELSEEHAHQIVTSLFGDSWTFRKGQIGAWKEEFTPEHKKLFKQYGGELLIKLGYEKDLNW